jgi:chromosome segregation ATPase
VFGTKRLARQIDLLFEGLDEVEETVEKLSESSEKEENWKQKFLQDIENLRSRVEGVEQRCEDNESEIGVLRNSLAAALSPLVEAFDSIANPRLKATLDPATRALSTFVNQNADGPAPEGD